MLKVAHNLRAPLSAGLSMLDLIEGGLLGPRSRRRRSTTCSGSRSGCARSTARSAACSPSRAPATSAGRSRTWSIDLDDLAPRRPRATFAGEAAQVKGLRLRGDRRARAAGRRERRRPAQGDDGEPGLQRDQVHAARRRGRGPASPPARPARCASSSRDTGIGVPAKEQDRLFQEFFRASNAKTAHRRPGTGLGLALVKQTVERHHGRIQLESAEGQGTTVTIDLPAHRVGQPVEALRTRAEKVARWVRPRAKTRPETPPFGTIAQPGGQPTWLRGRRAGAGARAASGRPRPGRAARSRRSG